MRLALASLVLLTGCLASAPVMPEAANEYVPTGEIQYLTNGASFDAVRVRNPNCNLTRRTDGSWGGTFAGQAVDVSVNTKRVTGVGITLSLEEETEKGVVITGQWQGRIVRFEVGQEKALIRTPTHSFTLSRSGPNSFGARGEMSVKGEAAAPIPPWPQFALAMLAAFN